MSFSFQIAIAHDYEMQKSVQNLNFPPLIEHAQCRQFLGTSLTFSSFWEILISTMWHEARKQEKKIRDVMINYQRRAERRKEHYEKLVGAL